MGVFDRFERKKQEIDKIDENRPNEYKNSNIILEKPQNGYFCSRAQSILSIRTAENDDLVDRIDSLPNTCPLKTGKKPPEECRFETRLFYRMISYEMLPDPETGCPIREVCRLRDNS